MRLQEKAGDRKASHDTPSSAAPPSSDQVSTSAFSLDSASSHSGQELRGSLGRPILWENVHLSHRIQPYQGHASCADDIYLLGRLLSLARLEDVDGDSVKLLLRSLRFLRRCDYSAEDVCSILAHASAYFLDAYGVCGRDMTASEVGNVLVTLMFIAHSYVQDETCPLRIWHQHLFRRYCPLATLNAAVLRLMEIRRYVLRLDGEDLAERYAQLMEAVRKPTAAETVPKEGDAPASILSRLIPEAFSW